jgi:hypothetical protein
LLYFAILLCFAFGLDDSALADSVGRVSKVQNQAQVGSIPAAVGTSVGMGDTLRTGANARLEVTFRDGTKLTLGENARVVIDRYVYNPDRSVGEMALNSTKGALRFTTGRIHDMDQRNVTVSTPYAALAVRGTEFWMGPMGDHYGALLLKGKVRVSKSIRGSGASSTSAPPCGDFRPL